MSVNDESFEIQTAHKILTFKDEDFENTQGKIIIDLKPLELGRYYGEAVIPTEFELPREILTERAEYRRLNALAKDALFIDRTVDPIRYFYLEGDKLRILQGEKQVTVDKIEVVHGKKAVLAEDVSGHPYIELPANVAETFGNILWEKEIKNLALEHVGQNQITGHEYYKLNVVSTDLLPEVI